MRKLLFYTILILLIFLYGCSDFTSLDTELDEGPVVMKTVDSGDILGRGELVNITYTVNETEQVLDRLTVTVTGPESEIVYEKTIEEEPLSGWAEPVEFDEDALNGLYVIRFDFYTGEDLFYSDSREFFISESTYSIISIGSYPPVLYPGGGGLIHAQLDSVGDGCWLRWSLDDEVIAEGTTADGFSSIEIEAPESEGVYSLRLEVFPLGPAEGKKYDFKSEIIKEVPLYVNTDQKSSVNEFGPEEDFYTLFHFRGNLMNSVKNEIAGVDALTAEGNPALSVRNGIFGYYLDAESSFFSDRLCLPVKDRALQGFSLMASFIPLNISLSGEETGSEFFYSGTGDGSFSFRVGVFSDGNVDVELDIFDEVYLLKTDIPLITENVYTTVAVAVQPSEDELRIVLYKDGIRASETVFQAQTESASWMNMAVDGKPSACRIAKDLEVLLDEAGVYYKESADGRFVDPDLFLRSMELEYGRFLMYAEGFDNGSETFVFSDPGITIGNSTLLMPPGSSVEFPPLFPGYEEVAFIIELAEFSTDDASAVIYVEGGTSEVVSIDFPSVIDDKNEASFSLVFSKESVTITGNPETEGVESLSGDFSSVGYSIVNNDPVRNLVIKSIVVIRKNINISEKGPGWTGVIPTEIKT